MKKNQLFLFLSCLLMRVFSLCSEGSPNEGFYCMGPWSNQNDYEWSSYLVCIFRILRRGTRKPLLPACSWGGGRLLGPLPDCTRPWGCEDCKLCKRCSSVPARCVRKPHRTSRVQGSSGGYLSQCHTCTGYGLGNPENRQDIFYFSISFFKLALWWNNSDTSLAAWLVTWTISEVYFYFLPIIIK